MNAIRYLIVQLNFRHIHNKTLTTVQQLYLTKLN